MRRLEVAFGELSIHSAPLQRRILTAHKHQNNLSGSHARRDSLLFLPNIERSIIDTTLTHSVFGPLKLFQCPVYGDLKCEVDEELLQAESQTQS